MLKDIDFWINLIANVFTIITSGLAVYLFVVNREQIASAVHALVNYSIQQTVSDLKYKIERLNDYNASDKTQSVEVINLLHDIEGQIIGNKTLSSSLSEQLAKISNFTTNPRLLTEPKKRSLVSELREKVRHVDLSNYRKILK